MTTIEELERWHRLWNEGIDPDRHKCLNEWYLQEEEFGPTGIYPSEHYRCSICSEFPEYVAPKETLAKPSSKVNLKKLAIVLGVIAYYVTASVLLMTFASLASGLAAWVMGLFVLVLTIPAGAVLCLLGVGFYALWIWIRE